MYPRVKSNEWDATAGKADSLVSFEGKKEKKLKKEPGEGSGVRLER